MNVTFKWKLIGSDAFEQTIYGDDFERALDMWQELWGIKMSDCEAFSFSFESSRAYFDMHTE